jgi:hypothetical protein
VLQTAVLDPHPVHPLLVMQTLPRPCALQSASDVQLPASEQKTSSAQKHFKSPNRAKQYEPSPTSLLHVPQNGYPSVQPPHGIPRHNLWAFFFLQRPTDAEARVLLIIGAAHAAAPASPMFRSISRREIRLPSITHRTAAVLPSRRGLIARVCPGSRGVQHRVLQTPVSGPHSVHPLLVTQTLPRPCALQSVSDVHRPASAQNTSSAQKHLRSPNREKHHEPSPTSLLRVPHWPNPHVHAHQHGTPLQSRWAFFFVQRSTDAEARRPVRTGAAQVAAPATPMVRSNSRREIRWSSSIDSSRG